MRQVAPNMVNLNQVDPSYLSRNSVYPIGNFVGRAEGGHQAPLSWVHQISNAGSPPLSPISDTHLPNC
jgi:hypothetical protein